MIRRSLLTGLAGSAGVAILRPAMGQNALAPLQVTLLPVAVGNFQGANGKVVTENLRAALSESRFFQLVNQPNGVPVVTGEVGSGYVEGRLIGPNGEQILRERFDSGDARLDARRFADQVTLALAKRRGIASSQIAFVAPRGPRQLPEICLCDGDGKNLRQLTKDGQTNLAPSISKDGSQILYTTAGSGKAGVMLYDLVDGSLSQVNKNPAAHAVGSLAPDGKTVALAAGSTAHTSDLFLVTIKGSKTRRLTATPNPEMTPAWSPDGQTIVFSVMTGPEQSDLYTIGIDSKAVSRPIITGLPRCSNPDWSPDGKRIAFSSLDPSSRQPVVCVVDLVQGGRVRRLVDGDEPVWGADSRHLVHTTSAGLSITDADSGATRQIVGGLGRVTNPTWTR